MATRLRWLGVLLCLMTAWLPYAVAAPPDQVSTTARLDAVRNEIRALAAAQRKAESALAERQQALATLETERSNVQGRLDGQREALAELLRAAYTLGQGSDLRVLLGQLAPCTAATATPACSDHDLLGRLHRALAYSRYFQRDRLARINTILADLAALDKVHAQIVAETAARQTALDSQRQSQAALQAARTAQKRLLVEAEASIRARGKRLQSLGEEEKTLGSLLERLRNVFADIPRAIADERPFAQRRGRLPWPLTGSAKPDNHGLLIGARPGTPVHAVAHGRVAYAAWLRGYGMLMIVDHGDGWMSLYGGNESLLREVGSWVDAGDVIATSGRAEGGDTGLYFGLRHNGKSIDPKPWLRGKP